MYEYSYVTYRHGRKGTTMQRLSEEQITPGVIVVYTLRADQRSRHPEKEWHGKVMRYYRDFQRAMLVSLEEGYEGCEEDVWLEQVVRIECEEQDGRSFFLARVVKCFYLQE
jgi:hypothetical protein